MDGMVDTSLFKVLDTVMTFVLPAIIVMGKASGTHFQTQEGVNFTL